MRVLIVEDEPDLREALVEILSDAGYRCVEAFDVGSAEALLASDGHRLDVVLLDLHLPDASVETLVDELKRRELFTILTTADTTAKAKQIASRWSLELIVKPFDVEQLLDLLERHSSKFTGPPPIA
jgi:DNA-binding response OmpR family regulator